MVASTTVAKKKTVRAPRKSVDKILAHNELHAYIPNPQVAERYVNRKVFGVWDAAIANHAMQNDENILLSGDTGAGKTLFSEAVASKRQVMYYSLPCDVSIDPSSLFGRMQPTDVLGKFEWQDGPVTQIVRGPCGLGGDCEDPDCNGGVLNVSEVNFMTPKIAASLFSLFDRRRYLTLLANKGEIVRCHHTTLIQADMNPNYRGTMELNAAFKNRFEHKLPWNYDPEVEEQLVKFPTMRELASQIRELRDTEIRTPCSTNMLMEFEKFATDKVLGLDYAIQNFLATFNVTEQPSVARVFELHRTKIESDIRFLKRAALKKPVSDEELEEIEFEMEVED